MLGLRSRTGKSPDGGTSGGPSTLELPDPDMLGEGPDLRVVHDVVHIVEEFSGRSLAHRVQSVGKDGVVAFLSKSRKALSSSGNPPFRM